MMNGEREQRAEQRAATHGAPLRNHGNRNLYFYREIEREIDRTPPVPKKNGVFFKYNILFFYIILYIIIRYILQYNMVNFILHYIIILN